MSSMKNLNLNMRIKLWLAFAKAHKDNPWKVWAKARVLGLDKRTIEKFFLEKGISVHDIASKGFLKVLEEHPEILKDY
ncbi:MAG: hypothetical protein QXU03_03225 [Desulfurococcaceae archaeon]